MEPEKLKNELELLYKTCDCSLIKTENKIATVNGIPLNFSDFGTLIHNKPIDIGFPKFVPGPSTTDTLNKYGITEEKYQLISQIMECYMAETKRSFKLRESLREQEIENCKIFRSCLDTEE